MTSKSYFQLSGKFCFRKGQFFMRRPLDEAIQILDFFTLLCSVLYDALHFQLFVTSNFTTVVGHAAICNAAIRHYMATILKRFPATTAFLFFIPHIKLSVHERVHDKHCQSLAEDTIALSL